MEALREGGYLTGVKIGFGLWGGGGGKREEVYPLLFMDDTLIFCEVS